MALFIHIGTGKTGTTSIQSFLRINREKFQSIGLNYPETKWGEHNLIEAVLLEFDKWHRVFKSMFSENKNELIEMAIRAISDISKSVNTYPTTLISGEYFLGFRKENIIDLIERCGCPINEIYIICYVRPPASFWVSGLQQRLKGSTSIDNALLTKYSFREGISEWMKVIPQKNFIIRPFDNAQLIENNVISDFQNIIFSRLEKQFAIVEMPIVENTAVSAEECILMQELREEFINIKDDAFNRDSSSLLRSIHNNAKEMKLTKMSFHEILTKAIDYTHRENLDWLENEFEVYLPRNKIISTGELDKAHLIYSQGRARDLLKGYSEGQLARLKGNVILDLNLS